MTECKRHSLTGQMAPVHWRALDFWTVARGVSDTGVPQEGLLSVYLDRGVIPYSEGGGLVHKPSESLDGYQLVLPGDFVLNNQQAWRGSVGVSNHRGIVSPAYLVFRLSPSLDPEFANYQFRDKRFVDQMMLCSQGVGDIQRQIKWPLLRKAKVFVPPREDQQAIVIHLNRATARIDALITKKTRFIELLREKRQALIAHAVTKGLNANVPLKDSGVEWLGKVPAHWDVVPPVALFTESKERAHDGDQMLSATQKYGVIPLAEFEALEQRRVTKASANLEMRKHVELGDFVISMRSMDGGLERSRAIGSVRSSYSVLKPGPRVEGRYFGALLKCSLYIQALRLTSNFIRDGQDLSFTHVKKVKLPKPGLEEQAAIADYLESATARIDTLIAKTERSIELLREHRTALITAAVTGKIDLRGVA